MDHRRPPRFGGEGQLRLEDGALGIPGGVIVVVVEAHLARSDDPVVPETLAEPRRGISGPGSGVVGMHAGGSGEPGLRLGQRQRPVGGGRRLPDDDDVPDPRVPGSAQHLEPIRLVGRIGEVAVRIDEQAAARRALSAWPVRCSAPRAEQA